MAAAERMTAAKAAERMTAAKAAVSTASTAHVGKGRSRGGQHQRDAYQYGS